jgi:AcrR family transcriptional regulator
VNDRERIGEALIDLCYEGSYRETTLEMVLERAEVDRATFELYFADLEDCFCEIYKEIRDEVVAHVAPVVERQETWRDGLRAAAYAMVDYTAEDEKRTNFSVFEVRSAGERALLLMAEAFEAAFDLIDRGRDQGRDATLTSRATAEAVGGSIFNQMYAAIASESIDAVRAKIPEMMYMAVLPYLGAEAAAEELRQPAPAPTGQGTATPPG